MILILDIRESTSPLGLCATTLLTSFQIAYISLSLVVKKVSGSSGYESKMYVAVWKDQ